MDIFLNILIIILAVIVLLLVYYFTAREDRKRKDYHLPLNRLETEFGEELGVDLKTMDHRVLPVEEKTKEVDEVLPEKYQLSDRYGEDYLRIFARDPEYLFAYWEINREEFYSHKPVLRLYHDTDNKYQDIELNHMARDWYLKCQADKTYRAELGYEKEGVFYSLISSNQIRTPQNKPSTLIDEHWMTIEELSLYSYRIEMDSMTLQKQLTAKHSEEIEANSYSLIH